MVVVAMPFRFRKVVTKLAVADWLRSKTCIYAGLIKSNGIEACEHSNIRKNRSIIFAVAVTVGLMLLTDDGELSHRILSPARHVDKTYRYTSAKPLDDEAAVRLQNGVYIEGGYLTAPCLVKRESDFTGLITIHEGKYHQIKQMFGAVGNEITALERISFGPLALDPALGRGQVRYLTSDEVAALRTASGLE